MTLDWGGKAQQTMKTWLFGFLTALF